MGLPAENPSYAKLRVGYGLFSGPKSVGWSRPHRLTTDDDVQFVRGASPHVAREVQRHPRKHRSDATTTANRQCYARSMKVSSTGTKKTPHLHVAARWTFTCTNDTSRNDRWRLRPHHPVVQSMQHTTVHNEWYVRPKQETKHVQAKLIENAHGLFIPPGHPRGAKLVLHPAC